MTLEELEYLKECNELDMLHIMRNKINSIEGLTERVLKGVKSNGVDVRKTLQDIRLLAEIMRDEIQNRKFKNKNKEETKLYQAIEHEKKRLIKEEERLKKLEEKREKLRLQKLEEQNRIQ